MSKPATAANRAQLPATQQPVRSTLSAVSGWWLVAVAGAFTALQLALVVPRLGLSWDEIVYVSQLNSHVPAAYFDPARARGVPVLVAPIMLLTGSVLALRLYLAVASGLALLVALYCWRGLRPAWQLALAGGLYGSLWVALYYGPQAMPDEWVAFAALAAVGCFLQAARLGPADRKSRSWLAGLAGSVAAAALVRPGDAVFLAGGLASAALAVRTWRRWPLLAATAAGLIAGSAEWMVEAYVRFGGPLARLHAAGAEQGGFGLHPAFWDEFRAVNGPTLCRPCTVGVRYPVVSLWWLALPVITVLGVVVARRAGRLGSSLLPAICGLAVAFQYLFLIDYAAPRFLLPSYALLAIPATDAIGWVLTSVRADYRPLALTLTVAALGAQFLVQQVVLHHQVTEKVMYFADYQRIAGDLHRLGVKPPCLVKGLDSIPIAYYAGCGSAQWVSAAQKSGEHVAVLERGTVRPSAYGRHWHSYRLHGIRTRSLWLIAYLPTAR